MLRGFREHAGNRGAARLFHLVEQLRASERLRGDDDSAFGVTLLELAAEHCDFAGTVKHCFEPGEVEFAGCRTHGISPREVSVVKMEQPRKIGPPALR